MVGWYPPTQWTWVWVDSGSWWWTGKAWCAAVPWGCKNSDRTQQLDWTELNWNFVSVVYIMSTPSPSSSHSPLAIWCGTLLLLPWSHFSPVWLCATLRSAAFQALCPWDSPGKKTWVGCHALLQGIIPNQGSNLGLLPCRQVLYH